MSTTSLARHIPRDPRALLVPVLFLIPPFVVSFIGNLWTDTGANTWYDGLEKASWQPPGWLFGLVWTLLYAAMGVAAYLVWQTRDTAGSIAVPMAAWVVQLILNLGWTFVFFQLESSVGGAIEIVFLWLAVLITGLLFARRSLVAGALFVPYLLWVTFAASLNFEIVRLN